MLSGTLLRKNTLLILMLVLASLLFAVVSVSAQDSPEDVAKALIAAEDSNNVDAAAALFADDAVVNLADGSHLDTPEGIKGWQQALADGHFRLEPVNMAVDGNMVTWDGTISLDLFRNLGIAYMASNWKLDIEDGKVKTFDFTFTPEAVTELTAGATVAGLLGAEAGHDVDAAVANFADDAVVTLADGSVFDTPDEIRGWQQELADGHFHLEPVSRHVDGNMVTLMGAIGFDPFRQMGIAMLDSVWNITVVDGKVTTFDFTFTPDALAMLSAPPGAAATEASS